MYEKEATSSHVDVFEQFAANLRPEPAAFMPEVGIRIDNTKKPLLAENFKAEAEGKIRLGPYGFVVQELLK